MSWHQNDKNNAIWYLSFLLNKIVNKRVSLSSIFFTMFCHEALRNACSVSFLSLTLQAFLNVSWQNIVKNYKKEILFYLQFCSTKKTNIILHYFCHVGVKTWFEVISYVGTIKYLTFFFFLSLAKQIKKWQCNFSHSKHFQFSIVQNWIKRHSVPQK